MERENEFILTASDQASRVFQDFDRNASTAMQGAAASTRGMSKETSFLTNLYREQRAEQRMQSFFMRQLKDVTGAAAIGLTAFNQIAGNSDNEMKKLNQSLMSGFIAFQGVDFALAALGAGPWGAAIAGVVGLGAAIASFAAGSKEAAPEIDRVGQFSKAVSEVTMDNVEAMNAYITALSRLRQSDAMGELKKESESTWNNIKSGAQWTLQWLFPMSSIHRTFSDLKDDALVLKNLTLDQFITMNGIAGVSVTTADSVEKVTKRQKEQADAVRKVYDETDALNKKQLEMLGKVFPEQAKENQILTDRLMLLKAIGQEAYNQFFDEQHRRKMEAQKKKELPFVNAGKAPAIDAEAIKTSNKMLDDLIPQFDQMGLTAQNTAQLIAFSMQDAAGIMVEAMNGATVSVGESFKRMLMNLEKMFLESMLKNLFMGALNLITGGIFNPAGSVGGTAIPATGGFGMSKTVPMQPKSQATGIMIQVLGSMSEANTDDRKRTMRKIERAIFTEKY